MLQGNSETFYNDPGDLVSLSRPPEEDRIVRFLGEWLPWLFSSRKVASTTMGCSSAILLARITRRMKDNVVKRLHFLGRSMRGINTYIHLIMKLNFYSRNVVVLYTLACPASLGTRARYVM